MQLKIALFIAAAFCIYLLANGRVCLWDRDEPRYAQASRQMLQSGDWIVPHFLDEIRTAKPAFVYWCQAAAMKLMGDHAFAARFPSAVAMMLTLILLAAVIYRVIGPRRALWSIFILGTSALTILCAKICTTDAVMLLWVTVAQICICSIWIAPRNRGIVALMWVAIALGGLTKGPVVLGICFTTMLALSALDVGTDFRSLSAWRDAIRWWPRTRPLLGIVILAAICGPWLYVMERRVPGYLRQTLWTEIWRRSKEPQEGHNGPPGYYLLTIWVTYFPWSLLLPAAIVQGFRRRRIPVIRFCLAAVIGPWLMFEIVQTKLPHYLLPIFPALAFLTADLLVRAGRRRLGAITDRGFCRIVAGWGALVVLLSLVPWLSLKEFSNEFPMAARWWLIVLTLLSIEYARTIWMHFRAHQPTSAAAVMGIGMMILVAAIYGGYLRHAVFLQTSRRVANVLRENHAHNVMMLDYKEPSLAFYQGGTIRPNRDNRFLNTHPRGEWPAWVVITRNTWHRLPPDIQRRFDLIDSVRGWNYSDGGRVVDVLVLRQKR